MLISSAGAAAAPRSRRAGTPPRAPGALAGSSAVDLGADSDRRLRRKRRQREQRQQRPQPRRQRAAAPPRPGTRGSGASSARRCLRRARREGSNRPSCGDGSSARRLGALLHQRRHAVEHAAALAAAHRAAVRGELLALHAKGGAAGRAARDQAHRRSPASSAQPSSRPASAMLEPRRVGARHLVGLRLEDAGERDAPPARARASSGASTISGWARMLDTTTS